MHRLISALQVTLLDDSRKTTHLLGLVARIHRQVGPVPVTEHTQPF